MGPIRLMLIGLIGPIGPIGLIIKNKENAECNSADLIHISKDFLIRCKDLPETPCNKVKKG